MGVEARGATPCGAAAWLTDRKGQAWGQGRGAAARGSTGQIRGRYDRVAPWYDRLERRLEREHYRHWRARLWALARGPRVLEVGVGTGKNVFYHPLEAVVALDFSPGMVAQARQRLARAAGPVALCRMDVQCLGFPAATFDTVAATFVFGSVPDPVAGLREVGRDETGGRILLLEYVRPAGLARPGGRRAQSARAPGLRCQRQPPHGRERAAGRLVLERVEPLWGDAVLLIVARRRTGGG